MPISFLTEEGARPLRLEDLSELGINEIDISSAFQRSIRATFFSIRVSAPDVRGRSLPGSDEEFLTLDQVIEILSQENNHPIQTEDPLCFAAGTWFHWPTERPVRD